MKINFVEIQNFRKLKSVRIDFAAETTLFVGANNSGKTSGMVALGHFLVDHRRFTTTDFTLSNWAKFDLIGKTWEAAKEVPDFTEDLWKEWQQLLPSLDVWIKAEQNEIHYISHLLPTLNWAGEQIGVRLQYEPKDLEALYKEFIASRNSCRETMEAANTAKKEGSYTVSLWPTSMRDFLERRLNTHFTVRGYILNHANLALPVNGRASPQVLTADSKALESNPFSGLIKINEINAQRGFSDIGGKSGVSTSGEEEGRETGGSLKLSEQLRSYYSKHLDPSELPEPTDIEALEGIFQAQEQFNKKLKDGFDPSFQEIEGMGYPGITDPRLSISTRIQPIDGLRHASALQYEVIASGGSESGATPRLPEQSSGLGYQNLISIIFRLMSYRDSWMQVGKASKSLSIESGEEAQVRPTIHLVLVEEPEAHLHAQVQQVFIRKAYDVLRNHPELKDKVTFATQLIVSTHSSHIVHECDFASLRYFRRLPAEAGGETPISAVVNLSEVFGGKDKTEKFAVRYLRTTHCDLFFADAAVLVEGAAERMLIPHFIREKFNNPFHGLNQRYISILEIGGSHSHRLQPLIDHIGLPTLIITDLDSGVKKTTKSKVTGAPPERKQGMVTMNTTLKDWIPGESDLDKLLDAEDETKIKESDRFSLVRVAYQTPIMVKLEEGEKAVEACAYTFEDSFVLENLALFRDVSGTGLVAKFQESIGSATDTADLVTNMYADLKGGDKAKFALDVICEFEPEKLTVPSYIRKGLEWLEEQLKLKDEKITASVGTVPSNAAEAISTEEVKP